MIEEVYETIRIQNDKVKNDCESSIIHHMSQLKGNHGQVAQLQSRVDTHDKLIKQF